MSIDLANLANEHTDILMPNYLPAVSLKDLYEMSIPAQRHTIEGLVSVGLNLLAGAPKSGKSLLVCQMAYHIATDNPLWGRSVDSGTVLYLALEDTFGRLQQRAYRMFETEDTDNLYFALTVQRESLTDQLSWFIDKHPRVKLVIIDTLARVRNTEKAASYLNDYEDMARLKAYADDNGIAILLVHHTRKQPAEDVFATINGTTAILGAVDAAMVLSKDDRTRNDATLTVTGRDIPDQLLKLSLNPTTLTWQLVDSVTDLWVPAPDPILEAIGTLMNDKDQWIGAPQDLVDLLQLEMRANVLSRHLNVSSQRLFDDYGITYSNRPRHEGRRITLCKISE